jgi:hypothetical protein
MGASVEATYRGTGPPRLLLVRLDTLAVGVWFETLAVPQGCALRGSRSAGRPIPV